MLNRHARADTGCARRAVGSAVGGGSRRERRGRRAWGGDDYGWVALMPSVQHGEGGGRGVDAHDSRAVFRHRA
eukprot:scaffold28434_cov67-Phaeocystis_antarctica.AAC.1